MSRKSFIWLFLIVFSALGSYLPTLWGAGMFSFSSVILSTVGGAFGIWLGFKLGE